jgi:ketosteroid isomerase-like protein
VGSENVEVVHLLLEAYERDDVVAQLALMDPEVEIVEWPDSPEATTYRGHAGAIRAGETWSEAWEWIRNEVDDFVDAGDRVLVCGRTRGKGRGSTVEVAIDAFNVYTVRDGKVTRMEFFTSREPALRAAGLTQSPTESEEST